MVGATKETKSIVRGAGNGCDANEWESADDDDKSRAAQSGERSHGFLKSTALVFTYARFFAIRTVQQRHNGFYHNLLRCWFVYNLRFAYSSSTDNTTPRLLQRQRDGNRRQAFGSLKPGRNNAEDHRQLCSTNPQLVPQTQRHACRCRRTTYDSAAYLLTNVQALIRSRRRRRRPTTFRDSLQLRTRIGLGQTLSSPLVQTGLSVLLLVCRGVFGG